MAKQLTLDEVKTVGLEVLDYVDKFCTEHGISYSLGYGTLLGAIRHKGFIPWDDDIDIIMYRTEYNRFLAEWKEHERYDLLSVATDPNYYYEFTKVVDKRTSVQTEGVITNDREGVWIDIFPVDDLGRFGRLKKRFITYLVVFRVLSVYKEFPSNKRSKSFYPIWLIARKVGFRLFLKLSNWLSQTGKDTGEIGYMCSLGVPDFAFPKRLLSKYERVQFEDKTFMAMSEYSEYLKRQYGDYMQLPPIEKRIHHPVEAYWKDSFPLESDKC